MSLKTDPHYHGAVMHHDAQVTSHHIAHHCFDCSSNILQNAERGRHSPLYIGIPLTLHSSGQSTTCVNVKAQSTISKRELEKRHTNTRVPFLGYRIVPHRSMFSGKNDNRGSYAHLQQSLVAPEGDLPTTTATVSEFYTHSFVFSQG